ncbi:uncharacterized protein LOC130698863 [Daphnia carinata]|uniref:uncharacterized protein LOC130698863 n=1 Tax=Daphnia carinata TaxID=120202 RepID=UPI00257EECD3|nr:uncharacterized protein LOC130698863 [Daphnia carinata]
MGDRSESLWVHPAAVLTDTMLSLCLVAPMVVCYWRGTWFLLDVYLYPDDTAISCWISLVVGFGILLLATWFQRYLQDYVTRQAAWLYFLLSRLYTVVLCLGCVNHWRGVWGTLDVYTGIGWTTASMSLVIGVTGLIWLHAFRNIMAPPLVIIVDDPEEYFTFPTMFRTLESKQRHLIALDGLFSVTVVGSLVVLVWRGSFLLLDLVMFPEDVERSAWGSTILGYSSSLFSFALQAPLAVLCSRITGIWRIVVLDVSTAVGYLGSVNVWRGLWNLYDIYLFPEHKVWSNLLTHVAGLAVLSICYCAHSILVRGVYLDAEEPGADAAALPYYYVRYFILKRRRVLAGLAAEVETTEREDERKQRDGRVIENGWLPEEVVTMIDESPDEEDHRWKGSNNDKESAI